METNLKPNAELEEDTGSQVSTVCLGTPVILREVLQQFSNPELVKLSLVNKQWNYEARSVLRDRGNTSAILQSNQSCQILGNFAADLEKMPVVPFSGIHLRLRQSREPSPSALPNESLDLAYQTILKRLPCRHFAINLFGNWETYRGTAALELVIKMLSDFGRVLQDLSFHFYWKQVEMPQEILQGRSFPRLKILRFRVDRRATDDQSFGHFVKAFVSRAPILEEVHIKGQINFNENVLGGSLAVLVLDKSFNPYYERVCESLVGALRPEIVVLEVGQQENLDYGLLDRQIPMVLQASRPSLRTLRVDLLFLVPLMCYGICLENVTTLRISIDEERLFEDFTPTVAKLLQNFDFTRVFPKLNDVHIAFDCTTFSLDGISGFVERGNALLNENLSDRVTNIKRLTLRYSVWETTVPFLAQMFPDARKLSLVAAKYSRLIPFTGIWDHFKFLEEIEIIPNCRYLASKSLDSVFCGIFPEESAELMEKDDEYLKAVNIVPVMPSIVCMRDLRNFTLRYTYESYLPNKGKPTSIFSNVTGLIAFARCPRLTVTFKCPRDSFVEALNHLRPYACFESVAGRLFYGRAVR